MEGGINLENANVNVIVTIDKILKACPLTTNFTSRNLIMDFG